MSRLLLLVGTLGACAGAPKAGDPSGVDDGVGEVPDASPGGLHGTGPRATDPTGWTWPTEVDLRVCADGSEAFVEVQDAIDASETADVIGVCPGTYGPIHLGLRQDLTLVGVAGPAVTTIDGG